MATVDWRRKTGDVPEGVRRQWRAEERRRVLPPLASGQLDTRDATMDTRADPTLRDRSGDTALAEAERKGHEGCAKLLRQAEAAAGAATPLEGTTRNSYDSTR